MAGNLESSGGAVHFFLHVFVGLLKHVKLGNVKNCLYYNLFSFAKPVGNSRYAQDPYLKYNV